ncbi:MAG TPA: polysaccharide deacetylase family protein [Gemmatimonadaceae bacterium]
MNMWSLLERAFGWGGVIAYHGVGEKPLSPVMHVSPARLREQLELLRDRYSVVPLRDLVERWRRGGSTRGCVAITFDDAYAGVAVHALPILRELDLPATIFVASDHAARGATYWWDDVERQRLAHGSGPWSEAPGVVGLTPSPAADAAAMERVRSRVITRFAGRWPHELQAGGDTLWRSHDFGELTSLARDERIEFGVHTLSHPALPLLPYREQVAEMRDCLTLLRERLPRVLPVIAYPYGLYDRGTARAAVEAGMIAGLTMEGRATSDRPDPMVVPRIGGAEVRAAESLAWHLNRALRPALIIRNRGRHPRLPVDRPSRPTIGI